MDRAAAGTTDANDLVPDRGQSARAGAGSPGGIVERLASVLRHYRFRVNVFTDLDAVMAAADRAWRAGELRALVAAGGDGTVAELVNRTGRACRSAVFPLGTANLLAGYLSIRRDISAICQHASPRRDRPARCRPGQRSHFSADGRLRF